MLTEIIWFITGSFALLRRWSEYDHCVWIWLGVGAYLATLPLLAGLVKSLFTGRLFRKKGSFPLFLIGTAALAMLLVAGSAAVLFSTHLKRQPQPFGEVAGAQVREIAGSADAPYGLLVLVGGYGSESPLLGEPAALDAAWDPAAPPTDPLVPLFRRRIFVRLHGGFGWNDWKSADEIGSSLDAYVLRRQRELGLEGVPAVLIAHSRGAQIAAATAAFRGPDWIRIAACPPAGVHANLRLFSRISPEISDIHQAGIRAAAARLADPADPRHFPWTAVCQTRAFDHVVRQFTPATGLPLRSLPPAGAHTLPVCERDTPFWHDVEAELRSPRPYSQAQSH